MQNPEEYFMHIAEVIVTRANCLRRHVGAVLVKDNFLKTTGYNGTARAVKNCTEGGCVRCYNSIDYPPGTSYDLCTCIHAEENCFLQAARLGIAIDGATLYTTLQPCLSCLKSAVNAGVISVIYRDPFIVPLAQLDDYTRLINAMSIFQQYTAPEPIEEPWDSGKISTFG